MSGSSFPGGLGGTRMRRRKMHFFFLISLPQRNLGVGRERRKLWSLSVHPPGEESQVLKTSLPPPRTPSYNPERRGDPESTKPVGRGLRRLPVLPHLVRRAPPRFLLCLNQPPDGLSPLPGGPHGGNRALSPAAGELRHLPPPAELPGGSEGPRCSPTPRRLSPETAGGPMRSSVGRAVSGPQGRRRRKTEWLSLSREAWGGLAAVRGRGLFTVASAPTQGCHSSMDSR